MFLLCTWSCTCEYMVRTLFISALKYFNSKGISDFRLQALVSWKICHKTLLRLEYRWHDRLAVFLGWISLHFKRNDWDTKEILFVILLMSCAGFARIAVKQWWRDQLHVPPSLTTLLDTTTQCRCPEGYIKTHTHAHTHAHIEREGQPWGHDGLALRQRSIVAQIKGSWGLCWC